MTNASRVGRLHIITDTTVQTRFSHEEIAELACAGGADVIQLRDKHLEHDQFLAVARRVRDICTRSGALFIVNDRVEVAREAGADGVHLGRGDAGVATARAVLAPAAVIGVTAGSLDDARAAEEAGADYVGFGHVFATTSKSKPGPPVGLPGLAAACAAVRIPVIAIGGIRVENAREVVRTGAWGIAVIAAVCAADDPRAATARLRAELG